MRTTLLLLLALSVAPTAAAQTTLFSQSFEGSGNWSFTADPAAGTFTSSSDVFDPTMGSFGNLTTMPTEGATFWGIQDVENPDNVRGTDAVLDFASVSVSGQTSVRVRFDYEVDGYDNGDDMFYTLTVDGTPQTEVQFVDGASNLDQSGTIDVAIPDGSGSVALQVRVNQNGGDFGGWDNFRVVAGAAAPDTEVAFAAATATQAEGNSGTTDVTVTLSITNPSASAATNVTLTRSGTSDGTDATLSSTTVTFAAGSSDDETVTITVNGDTDIESDETLDLTISSVSGGTNATAGSPNTYSLVISDDDAPAPDASALSGIVINEILYDESGANGSFDTDGSGGDGGDEFIELYNTTGAAVDVSGWRITEDQDVITFPAGTSIAANGWIVVYDDDFAGTVPSGGLKADAMTLGNGGDTIYLCDASGNFVVAYYEGAETDGNDPICGTTQVGTRENFGEGDGQSVNRFPDGSNVFRAATPTPGIQNLPVELTVFTATADGNAAQLRWETASETNNTGFEVQMDGGSGFARLDFVQGAGTTLETSSYDFRVEGLAAGSYHFRLKQVDLDGAFEFSPVVELAIGSSQAFALTAAPNPFRQSASIGLQVATAQDVTVEVYDLLGRSVALLFEGAMDADQSRTFSLDGSDLALGLYVVRATGERFQATRQIVRLR